MMWKEEHSRIVAWALAISFVLMPLSWCTFKETEARYDYKSICTTAMIEAGKEIGWRNC